MKLAIIFTCYNRREITKRCLTTLKLQTLNKNISVKFYICDDSSTDGTVELIRKELDKSCIVIQSKDLFWCRGMHAAMKIAVEEDNDFYLMINDDVVFFPNAISVMIESYLQSRELCGIVGSIKAASQENTTYGGRNFLKKIKIGKTVVLNPNGYLQKCDLANWNCFLLPREIIKKVGLIDNSYEHGCGDFDYSLMMNSQGFNIYVATDYVGICDLNSITGTYHDNQLSKLQRVKKMFSIKERPLKSSIRFYYKHYHLFGLLYMIYIYIMEIRFILFSRK